MITMLLLMQLWPEINHVNKSNRLQKQHYCDKIAINWIILVIDCQFQLQKFETLGFAELCNLLQIFAMNRWNFHLVCKQLCNTERYGQTTCKWISPILYGTHKKINSFLWCCLNSLWCAIYLTVSQFMRYLCNFPKLAVCCRSLQHSIMWSD